MLYNSTFKNMAFFNKHFLYSEDTYLTNNDGRFLPFKIVN